MSQYAVSNIQVHKQLLLKLLKYGHKIPSPLTVVTEIKGHQLQYVLLSVLQCFSKQRKRCPIWPSKSQCGSWQRMVVQVTREGAFPTEQ